MANRCIFVGYVGEVDAKVLPNGTPKLKFGVGINRPGKEKHTDWINCVIWGKGVDAHENYLKKGRHVYIESRLEVNVMENKTRFYDFIVDKLEYLDTNKSRTDSNEK